MFLLVTVNILAVAVAVTADAVAAAALAIAFLNWSGQLFSWLIIFKCMWILRLYPL